MKYFVIMLMLMCGSLLNAQEASLQFEEANQAYRNAEYAKAAGLYEHIVKNGVENAELYYNLGNTYFKLKNTPAAILNYERAMRLAPQDEDIGYNLRLANLRVIDKIDPVPQLFITVWWQSFVGIMSSASWAMAGIIALWGCLGAAALFLFLNIPLVRRLAFFGGVVCIFFAVIAFIAMSRQAHAESNDQLAIIFSPSVSVKSAPDIQSTDLFVVHEGVRVEILDFVGDWKKIRLADGKTGWMPGDGMRAI